MTARPSRAGEALVTLTHRRSRETRSKLGRPAPILGLAGAPTGRPIKASGNTQGSFLEGYMKVKIVSLSSEGPIASSARANAGTEATFLVVT